MSFSLDSLRDLVRHMEWADASVWRVALAHPAAARDTRARDLLLHLHTVQLAFLNIWTKQPLAWPNPEDLPDLASVQRWSHPVYARTQQFLQSLDAAALDQPVMLPWAAQLAAQLGREPHHPTLGETLFQVASHSTYHRGQVNMRLRDLGAEPPLVDFIAWVWFGRPVPEWQHA